VNGYGESKDPTAGAGDTWGLASLGLGAAVLLAAPITLISNVPDRHGFWGMATGVLT